MTVTRPSRFTAAEFEREHRKRSPKRRPGKGSILPYPPEDDDVEQLRDWLTLAFRPRPGWRVVDFERSVADDLDQYCVLIVVNGKEHRRYRFRAMRELTGGPAKLRAAVLSRTNGELRIPYLPTAEALDVWECLCRVGRVLAEQSESDQARSWLGKFLSVARPIDGYSMEPGPGRRDALLVLQRSPDFTRIDANAVNRTDPDTPWPRYPIALIDRQTGDLWIKHIEAIVYLRYILDLKPFSDRTLLARWSEIGVTRRQFDDRGTPRLRQLLYRVTQEIALESRA